MARDLDRSERDLSPAQGEDSRLADHSRPALRPLPKGATRADSCAHEGQETDRLAFKERHAERGSGREQATAPRRRERTPTGREIYTVSPAERQTLYEIGRFRVIRIDDLKLYRYSGRGEELALDVRNLTRQGLLQKKTVWTGRDREKVTFLALTKIGQRFLKRHAESPSQALYTGFVKPAELRHDAAIYPMFQKEAARIANEGGHVGRVILDYELKRKAYSPLAKAKTLPADEYAKRQADIARDHGLKVVNGHIALPDLRIEYVTRDGLAASVDLELATESYHGSHAAEKAAAGFTIYAAPSTAARLSAALEEREITAEILSL